MAVIINTGSPMRVQLVGGPYVAKDQHKLDMSTHYAFCGSAASSSSKYWGQLVSHRLSRVVDVSRVGHAMDNALYVSVEGYRRGRYAYSPSTSAGQAVEHFLSIGGVVIADNEYDRRRSYNVGERELEAHLLSLGAVEFKPGMWHVRPTLSEEEIESLQGTIDGYLSRDRSSGFCSFVTYSNGYIFDWAIREWPKSASMVYPVPDPKHVTLNSFTNESRARAHIAYFSSTNNAMLRGEYGDLRREMLAFVRERVELAAK